MKFNKTYFNKVSQVADIEYGYGVVEPNHLSAQRTGQIYAQLPADASIDVLENGQFVKYDYAKGVVDFKGAGEWLLVFNEAKGYRDDFEDCEYAMLKGQNGARVYSPFGGFGDQFNSRENYDLASKDPAEPNATDKPFLQFPETRRNGTAMPDGTAMVPRCFKTNVGDIFTLNLVEGLNSVKVGDILKINAKGILAADGTSDMQFQVVAQTRMPDLQYGVKVMRIA